LSDHQNYNFDNDVNPAKAGLSNFVLFDEKQWDYIQHRYRLTPREKQIVKHVCRGFRNEEIAKDVNIALGTVKTHIRNVHRKTHTRSKIAVLLRFIYDVNIFEKQKSIRNITLADVQRPSNTNS
jgi:DNA-binding NarL/FixJ family response regulator